MATERSDFSTASAAQSDAAWYFIDSNRARCAIDPTGETLHFLYSTNAITKQTYGACKRLRLPSLPRHSRASGVG
ncbi:hypothetical protein EMIHUDRAFT_259646 [Emiliania huxleyi CCMP1516]|uniref:Uncharacterized protein n=2 Tax=Emiliania huxleyi TaxID=2903 RepID=A0A0D3HZ74_EMIH1|nr:hypothetical protein EMIHUDRAFT_259646 [Emiliania huxleyi CCMP1516]EOD04309.1 hypothetical protein EMIHUDRAFT_259646 [Emiliania huxleyi CCMP1516]|eukprot:XP_005756738.1 hypothetical protein EMIHUDRAFT_259646 [Emiliania huxleyi CCMP1516]